MKRLFASCFGLGWLPVAPGTWGSIPPVVVFILLRYFGVAPGPIVVAMAALAMVGSVVCVTYAPASIVATGSEDPSEVVADEFAAQALTLIFAAMIAGRPVWILAAGAFLLFRLFDIIKPWPIRRLEKLPKGWGVLADDLLAAVYAGLALLVVCRLWGQVAAG